LIVDRSEENRIVLREALERRGLRILEAPGNEDGVRLAREHHPDLVVLDLEAGSVDVPPAIDSTGDYGDTPLVLLGTVKSRDTATSRQYVAKPYRYAPLIDCIESMLQERGAAIAKEAAR
jgi:CheY-like chemotaxis protein